MFCSNCGNRIDDSAKFCKNCGAKTSVEVNPTDQTVYGAKYNAPAKKVFSLSNIIVIVAVVLALAMIIGVFAIVFSANRLPDGTKIDAEYKLNTICVFNAQNIAENEELVIIVDSLDGKEFGETYHEEFRVLSTKPEVRLNLKEYTYIVRINYSNVRVVQKIETETDCENNSVALDVNDLSKKPAITHVAISYLETGETNTINSTDGKAQSTPATTTARQSTTKPITTKSTTKNATTKNESNGENNSNTKYIFESNENQKVFKNDNNYMFFYFSGDNIIGIDSILTFTSEENAKKTYNALKEQSSNTSNADGIELVDNYVVMHMNNDYISDYNNYIKLYPSNGIEEYMLYWGYILM